MSAERKALSVTPARSSTSVDIGRPGRVASAYMRALTRNAAARLENGTAEHGPTANEDERPADRGSEVQVVRRHDDRDPALAVEPREQRRDLELVGEVE